MNTTLIPVRDAVSRIIDAMPVMAGERVDLYQANGHVLAEDMYALLTNPPADQSAMDGFAVSHQDLAETPVTLSLIGESAAGHPWPHALASGTAIRISTGANLPDGADTIIIQENTRMTADPDNADLMSVVIMDNGKPGRFIRRKGQDFHKGDVLVRAGTRLDGRMIGLLAAGGHHTLITRKKPVIVIGSTGSELIEPGQQPVDAVYPAQIMSSNTVMIANMITDMGGHAITLPPIADQNDALEVALSGITDADLLILTGGASVGRHDLVSARMKNKDTLNFWRIAMRPGKPMIFGQMDIASGLIPFLGLPGNPVSSGVCTLIFVRAAIDAMLGLSAGITPRKAVLGMTVPENDEREEYMRGMISHDAKIGQDIFTPLPSQDSGKLMDFAHANALMIRPAHAMTMNAGDLVDVIRLK
jgi:molybdopterin molybdotransferase